MEDSPAFPREGGSELRLKDGDPKGESSVHSPCDEGCECCGPGLPGGGSPQSKSLFPPASPALTVPCFKAYAELFLITTSRTRAQPHSAPTAPEFLPAYGTYRVTDSAAF